MDGSARDAKEEEEERERGSLKNESDGRLDLDLLTRTRDSNCCCSSSFSIPVHSHSLLSRVKSVQRERLQNLTFLWCDFSSVLPCSFVLLLKYLVKKVLQIPQEVYD